MSTMTPELRDRLRLLAIAHHATSMARFGLPLTRNAPTLAAVRRAYGLPQTVRRWADAAPILRAMLDAEQDDY